MNCALENEFQLCEMPDLLVDVEDMMTSVSTVSDNISAEMKTVKFCCTFSSSRPDGKLEDSLISKTSVSGEEIEKSNANYNNQASDCPEQDAETTKCSKADVTSQLLDTSTLNAVSNNIIHNHDPDQSGEVLVSEDEHASLTLSTTYLSTETCTIMEDIPTVMLTDESPFSYLGNIQPESLQEQGLCSNDTCSLSVQTDPHIVHGHVKVSEDILQDHDEGNQMNEIEFCTGSSLYQEATATIVSYVIPQSSALNNEENHHNMIPKPVHPKLYLEETVGEDPLNRRSMDTLENDRLPETSEYTCETQESGDTMLKTLLCLSSQITSGCYWKASGEEDCHNLPDPSSKDPKTSYEEFQECQVQHSSTSSCTSTFVSREDNVCITTDDNQIEMFTDESTITNHTNIKTEVLKPCSNLRVLTEPQLVQVQFVEVSTIITDGEVCIGSSLSPAEIQETTIPPSSTENADENVQEVIEKHICPNDVYVKKLEETVGEDPVRKTDTEQHDSLPEASEYSCESHVSILPNQLHTCISKTMKVPNFSDSLASERNSEVTRNLFESMTSSLQRETCGLFRNHVDQTNGILSDRLKSAFRKYYISSLELMTEPWYMNLSGSEGGHLGLSSENYDALGDLANLQNRNNKVISEPSQQYRYSYDHVNEVQTSFSYMDNAMMTNSPDIEEVVEEVLQLLVDNVSCLDVFWWENGVSEHDPFVEMMNISDAERENSVFSKTAEICTGHGKTHFEEFTKVISLLLDGPDDFIVKQDVSLIPLPCTIPDCIIECDVPQNPDSPCGVSCESGVNTLPRTNNLDSDDLSHSTCSRKSKSPHNEDEDQQHTDGNSPCKVRILEHELCSNSTMTSNTGASQTKDAKLYPEEDVMITDQVVPCEMTICAVGYLNEQCSNGQSFFPEQSTDEKGQKSRDVPLSDFRLFSWKSAITLPESDRKVPELEISEENLPSLLLLKTWSKPRRVGLSRRQRLPPLHRNYRGPDSGSGN